MAGSKKPAVGLNDQERFPLISDLSLLSKLKQDQFAPIFNFQSGDRLDAHRLELVNRYAANILGNTKFWEKGSHTEWLEDYILKCIETVPFYKNRPKQFSQHPTINRGDISSAPWQFVSADSDLNDLLVYQTSGSTGAAMDVLFDPISQACYLPQLQSILDIFGISIDSGPDIVSIALICSQSSTLTYVSLSTYLGGAGILKINLNPSDWKDLSHRTQYLEKYNPQILTGDPFAFMDLLALKPKIKPKALVSSAMKLTDGIRIQLEKYFGCPVIDIYSLTECRMVAFAQNGRHRAIRPELYLEVLDKDSDTLLPYGERGELVITGGNNPFLPLIRYRTGDFCKLEVEKGIPYLVDLEARNPVLLFKKSGEMVNNIDISRKMSDYPLVGFQLYQDSNHNISFTGWSEIDLTSLISIDLKLIFGNDIKIDVSVLPIERRRESKTVTYSSDLSLKG